MERGSATRTACAACKHQRKRCDEKCILAPYFPSDRTREFQAVHKVFGLSNLQKMVRSLSEEDKRRATDSLIWEAFCRQKDPVLGPYGEYRRLFDELKLYKSQLQLPIQVSNFGTNNINGAVTDHQFGTPNNNVALLNYVQKNAGFASNQFTCSPHHKSPKGQGEIGSIILPLQQRHLVNGYNQQYCVKGQFSPMNGEATTMESITWEGGS
uniref:LOB domain-containing protein n=1 Tax=Kalanchoe fedtschenkoi TaxID=63787 RepID=A0A7N0TIX7_KALFE